MSLSKYFTLEEMTASDTATRHGLDNTPPPQVILNLKHLCVNLLDPVRAAAGSPIIVSSGYRSPAVNKKVGGSRTSQHVLGSAADIKCPAIGNKALYDIIVQLGLEFDQLIQEFFSPPDGSALGGGGWVHISLLNPNDPATTRGNNRQKLKAMRIGGKVVYERIR